MRSLRRLRQAKPWVVMRWSLASGTKLTRVLGLLIVVPAAIIYSSENGESGTNLRNLKNPIVSAASSSPLFCPRSYFRKLLPKISSTRSLLMVPIWILIGLSIRPRELLNVSKPIMIVGSPFTVCMMLASAIALVILIAHHLRGHGKGSRNCWREENPIL